MISTEGHVFVDIVNVKDESSVTPLTWDIAKRISNVFQFEGEVVIT